MSQKVNKIIMLSIKQQVTKNNKSHHSNLLAVKISNFNPQLLQSQTIKGRYSQDEKVSQRRNMVTSSLEHRHRYEPEGLNYRITRTSQQSRFSEYVEREISKIHEDKTQLEQFSPLIRDKIKELRGLIQEKAIALRNSSPQKYCFSQYKMKNHQESRMLSLTLHSRRKIQSPFMKTFKTRKIGALNAENNDDLSTLNKKSSKKMVLIGGSISFRETSPIIHQNSRLSSPKKIREQRGKIGHRYYLRRVLERPSNDYAQQMQENDCKPWQFHKLEHLQQQGNLHNL